MKILLISLLVTCSIMRGHTVNTFNPPTPPTPPPTPTPMRLKSELLWNLCKSATVLECVLVGFYTSLKILSGKSNLLSSYVYLQ